MLALAYGSRAELSISDNPRKSDFNSLTPRSRTDMFLTFDGDGARRAADEADGSYQRL